MKRIFELIEKRTNEDMKTHAFIKWLSSDELSVTDRLFLWFPALATFTMCFKDFNNLILKYPKEEAAVDQLKASINEHANEDGSHWKMLVKDIKTIGINKTMDLTSFLTFFWGKEVEVQRNAFYRLIIVLSQKAQHPLLRFCLISAFEKCGHTVFSVAVQLGTEYEIQTGKKLYYVGQTHLNHEEGHLECSPTQMKVQDELWQQDLSKEMYETAKDIVNEVFDINYQRWTGYLSFINSNQPSFLQGQTIN